MFKQISKKNKRKIKKKKEKKMKKNKHNKDYKKVFNHNACVLEDKDINYYNSINEYENISEINKINQKDLGVDTIISKNSGLVALKSPTLQIPRFVFYKLMTYVKSVNEEIAGTGYIEKISPDTFKLVDIYLVKQTVNKSHFEFDVDDDCKVMQKLINEGKNPSFLKLLWHSHVNMGTFWSQNDASTSRKSACDYFFSIVVCHNMDLLCKLNIYQPVELEIDNIKVVITDNEPISEMIKNLQDEIKKKVYVEKNKDLFQIPAKKDLCAINNGTQYAGCDNSFFLGGHEFRWNNIFNQYDVYQVGTNRVLEEREIYELGLEEYVFPNKYNENKPLVIGD